MDPVLLHIPASFTTKRLHLRICQIGDGDLMYPVAAASHAELARFLPWAENGIHRDGLEVYCRRQHGMFYTREQINYLMFLSETQEFLGCCGLVRTDWELRQFEIGYWLSTSKSGHGYMTEACVAILDLAQELLGATKVTLRCDLENVKSAAIAKRIGMTQEAVHPRWQQRPNGNWITLEEYGLICSGT